MLQIESSPTKLVQCRSILVPFTVKPYQLSLNFTEFQLSGLFHVVCIISMVTYCLKPHGIKRTNLTNYIHSPVPNNTKSNIDDDDDNDTHNKDDDDDTQ